MQTNKSVFDNFLADLTSIPLPALRSKSIFTTDKEFIKKELRKLHDKN